MGMFSQIHATGVSDIDDVDDCDAEYVGAEVRRAKDDETQEIDTREVEAAYAEAVRGRRDQERAGDVG